MNGADLKSEISIIGSNDNVNPKKYYFYTSTESPAYLGLVKKITDERGNDSLLNYDSTYSTYLSDTKNAENLVMENKAFDYRFGKPTSSFDANNKETTYSYDPFGRILNITYPDNSGRVDYEYDDFSMPRCVKTKTKKTDSSTIETYEYFDGLGRSVRKVTHSFTSVRLWKIHTSCGKYNNMDDK